MFEYIKFGDREILKPLEMSESTMTVLMEILAQNRVILEANCLAMRLIWKPMIFREDQEHER